MPDITSITSLTNPHIKAMRALHDRKHRRRAKLVLAEGVRIITEAVALGWRVGRLAFLAGREHDPSIARLIKATQAHGGVVLAVNEAVLAKITRKTNPQSAVACFDEQWQSLEDVLARTPSKQSPKPKAPNQNKARVWVALDRVRDPGNLGTIMRTLDAVAGAGIILIGACTDAYSVEAVRASMGACFNVRLVACDEAEFIAFCQHWRKIKQSRIIATSLTATVDYRTAEYTAPLIVLMGNEQSGLAPNLTPCATDLVRIPMAGRSDSLNLAVATALMLYQHYHHAPANGQKSLGG